MTPEYISRHDFSKSGAVSLQIHSFKSGGRYLLLANISLPTTTIMSANVTAVPSFHDSAYAGTDFTSLNWLEQNWVQWYIWIGNPVIATGLMSFLLHEVCGIRVISA